MCLNANIIIARRQSVQNVATPLKWRGVSNCVFHRKKEMVYIFYLCFNCLVSSGDTTSTSLYGLHVRPLRLRCGEVKVHIMCTYIRSVPKNGLLWLLCGMRLTANMRLQYKRNAPNNGKLKITPIYGSIPFKFFLILQSCQKYWWKLDLAHCLRNFEIENGRY